MQRSSSGQRADPADFPAGVGARLRRIRSQQGLSLCEVEHRSGGRLKTSVMGSYERSARVMSVQRLAEIADFYQVPVAALLPDPLPPTMTAPAAGAAPRLLVDLSRLAANADPRLQPLKRLVASVQADRGEYTGRVLSLRREDLRTLVVLYDTPADRLLTELAGLGVLLDHPSAPERS